MKIEIHGGQLKNKGAQKMLRTAVDKIRAISPQAEIFCDPVCGSKSELQELGIKVFSFSRGWIGGRLFSLKMRIQMLFGWLGVGVQFTSMDALVDVAGFAYSDQWGFRPTRDAAILARAYKKAGKTVLFMPQAFGPFERPEIRVHMKRLIENSDYIWARDNQSLLHLKSVSADHEKLGTAPDITQDFSVMRGGKGKGIKTTRRRLAIIPNIRMKSSAKFDDVSDYLRVLEQAASSEYFDEVIVVIHDDTGEDYDLVQLSAKLAALQCLNLKDSAALKSELSNFDIVVGSRYHGLVAALTQGIPVVSIGWSHKYRELMRDYGVGEFYYNDSEDSISNLIAKLMIDDNYRKTQKAILSSNKLNSNKLNSLWAQFADCLQ